MNEQEVMGLRERLAASEKSREEADERAAEVPGLRLRLAQTEDSATQAEAAWKAEYSLRLAAEKAREEAERERDAYRHEWNVSSRQQGAETRTRYAAESRAARLLTAMKEIRDELGVPQPGYPAPVANAARIARAAIAAEEGK